MNIEFKHNIASQFNILFHLQKVSSDFVEVLSERVNLNDYSAKIFSLAEREEAWCEEELIGLVAYYVNDENKNTFITNVSVDIRFQGQGIASELLRRASNNSRQRNMKSISLEVASDDKLLEFYYRNGFVLNTKMNNGNNELVRYLTPLVVIRCTVYNHEKYLRDCLDGFVNQKTNFPFVAIVHDDASTDGSIAIIKEYELKYPNIIKPIYEIENQYSKKDDSLTRIMNHAIDETGAKYIAMCEGDDYWTDPYKLQKQVDFMESNPDCSICFHNIKILINETGELKDDFIVEDKPEFSNILDLAKGNYIHTPSVLYRKNEIVQAKNLKMRPCLPGDYVLWMLLAETGSIYKMKDCMAVYRYGGGMWGDSLIIYRYAELLQTCSKLSIVIENLNAKRIINEQILLIKKYIISEYNEVLLEKNTIVNSKAYKLGYKILTILRKIKKYLNNK